MSLTTPIPTQRLAVLDDVPQIAELMRSSILEIFPRYYDEHQTASAAVHIAEPDLALIEDGTVDRLNAALEEVGAGPGTIGATGTSFMTRFGRLEVVRRADGIGGYSEWMVNARKLNFETLTIVVAAPADILRSKEAAGRDKDRQAIPGMRRSFEAEGLLDTAE